MFLINLTEALPLFIQSGPRELGYSNMNYALQNILWKSGLQSFKTSKHKKDCRRRRNNGSKNQPENNEQNGTIKSLSINNYFKHKWIAFSDQKTKNG